jgi:hypothetical protein
MREWILPDIKHVTFHTKRVTNLIVAEKGWKIQSQDELFETKKMIVCVGSHPKMMDLPKATLPLSQCLHKSDLEHHISPNDKVVVIGTAHSGTIIMKNLKDIGCTNVIGIYKEVPFVYARDGVLGGIKQESETIADEITQKLWGDRTPTLISYGDFSKVYRAIEKADFVLYSFGFTQPAIHYIDKDATEKVLQHDPHTSQFTNVHNAWGFGIAFPSYIQNTQISDVGFKGFIRAIQSSLPAILQ